MITKAVFLLILLSFSTVLSNYVWSTTEGRYPGPDEQLRRYRPNPAIYERFQNYGRSRDIRTSNIVVDTSKSALPFPDDALGAVQTAAGLLASFFNFSSHLTVNATWEPKTSFGNSTTTLAKTAAFYTASVLDTRVSATFRNIIPDGLRRQTQTISSPYDIYCFINSEVNWYTGTDGRPNSTQFDMVSVLLHEFIHGLGFTSNFLDQGYYSTLASPNYPWAFDVWIFDRHGNRLINYYPNNQDMTGSSPNVSAAIIDELFFNWFSAFPAPIGYPTQPTLETIPVQFQPGVSIGHLDQATYQNTPSKLMIPYISAGEVDHHPGSIPLLILDFLGYPLKNCSQYTTCTECQASLCGWCQNTSLCGDPGLSDAPNLFNTFCPIGFDYTTCNRTDVRINYTVTTPSNPINLTGPFYPKSTLNIPVTIMNNGPLAATNVVFLIEFTTAFSNIVVVQPNTTECTYYDATIAPLNILKVECVFSSITVSLSKYVVIEVTLPSKSGSYITNVTVNQDQIDQVLNTLSFTTAIVPLLTTASPPTDSSVSSFSDSSTGNRTHHSGSGSSSSSDGIDVGDFSNVHNPLLWVVVAIAAIIICACICLAIVGCIFGGNKARQR